MPPLTHLDGVTADLLARAARVRLACFDVDGTLTDGRLIFDSEGRELKAFHVRDGQGLALLRNRLPQARRAAARIIALRLRRVRRFGWRCRGRRLVLF